MPPEEEAGAGAVPVPVRKGSAGLSLSLVRQGSAAVVVHHISTALSGSNLRPE